MVVDAPQPAGSGSALCDPDLNFAKRSVTVFPVMYAPIRWNMHRQKNCWSILCIRIHRIHDRSHAGEWSSFSEGFAMAHEDYAEGGCKYAPRCRFYEEKCGETPRWQKWTAIRCAVGFMPKGGEQTCF